MENTWTKINDDVPFYMEDICRNHNLVCVKISDLQTALVGKDFAIVIGIDRFYAEVSYWHKQGRRIKEYACGNYFAERYDANDRVCLLEEEGENWQYRT